MTKAWSARNAAERRDLEAAFVARHGAELLLDGDAEPPPDADPRARPTGRRAPFSLLYASLHRSGPLPAEISEALRADPDLRDDFTLLLERNAWQHLPRAAAAAGRDGLERREGGGFVLRVVESRAAGEQVYLLIELPEAPTRGAGIPEREPATDEPSPVPGPDAESQPEAGTEAGAGDAPPAPASKHPTGGPAPRPGERPVPGSTEAAPDRLVVRTAEGEYLKRALPSPDARTIRLVMAADDPLVRAVAEPSSEIFLL